MHQYPCISLIEAIQLQYSLAVHDIVEIGNGKNIDSFLLFDYNILKGLFMGISSNSIRTDAISMMMVQDVGETVGS